VFWPSTGLPGTGPLIVCANGAPGITTETSTGGESVGDNR